MNKAQGLPITTIIIAALGLLVLVVVGAIFGGQIFRFGITDSTCPGTCVSPTVVKGTTLENFVDIDTGRTSCNEVEKALTGSYIARVKDGVNPKEHIAKCGVCCVISG